MLLSELSENHGENTNPRMLNFCFQGLALPTFSTLLSFEGIYGGHGVRRASRRASRDLDKPFVTPQ